MRPLRHLCTTTTAIVLAASVFGCTTRDPYTGEEQVSNTTKGAAIGAAAGAVVGLVSGDDAAERRKRALIGAGVGGLSGGAIGQYMDRQEAELRRQLRGTGVSVTRQGDDIVLNMPGNVTFALDSASLEPQFFDVLNSVARVLEGYPKTVVQVAGHTDSTGPSDYNQQLSRERAATVADYLRSQGIDGRRMVTRGYGEAYPVATNETETGRAQNRRVELTLTPLTEQ